MTWRPKRPKSSPFGFRFAMRLSGLVALCAASLFLACSRTVDGACILGCLKSPPSFFVAPWPDSKWWNGPNVCKINRTEPASDSDKRFEVAANGMWLNKDITYQRFYQTCRDYRNAYVCIQTVASNGTTKKTVAGYRCCPGYDRALNDYGCQKETPVTNLMDTLRRLNLTILASALANLNIQDAFAGKRVTFFAPTNEAVTKNSTSDNGISHVVVFNIGDEPQLVRHVLMGATVDGELNTWDLVDKQSLRSLQRDGSLIVTPSTCCEQPFLINCASVTHSDVPFENGVIHVVDALVRPAEGTLWELLNADPKFSKFLSLADDDTKRMLNDPNSRATVFAFTNQAFDRLPQETKQSIEMRRQCFKDLIKHHMLKEPLCLKDLDHLGRTESMLSIIKRDWLPSSLLNDANGTVKIVKGVDGRLHVDNSTIVGENVVAKNGIMYTVDSVILPAEIRSPVDNLARFSPEMRSLLEQNEIMKIVGDSPYSILMPPAEVLNEMANVNDGRRRRESLLKYVIRGDLSGPDAVVYNFANEPLQFQRASDAFWPFSKPHTVGYVNCTKVLSTRTASCNGALYELTDSLPAYDETVMELLKRNAEMKQFVLMVEAAGLSEALSDPKESVTVMAFTDKTFDDNYDAKAKGELMNDQHRLRRFIGGHIMNGSFCCNDLASGFFSPFDGRRFDTIDGQRQLVSGADACCMHYGSSAIAKCNLGMARNGVVHLLKGTAARRTILDLFKPFDFPVQRRPFDSIFGLF